MISSKTTTAGFLDLPIELRLQIYAYIITSIPAMAWPTENPYSECPPYVNHIRKVFVAQRIPSSHELHSYRGLILSCKTVYHEFEHEWLKVYAPWFRKEFEVHNFVLPTISKIGDTTHLRIGLPLPPDGWLDSPTDIQYVVRKLVNNLPSFCLYPISSIASDHTPLTQEQIARFKLGAKGKKKSYFLHAMRLVAHEVTRLGTGVNTFNYRPIFGEDFQNIAMNWAWKEVVVRRKEMVEWKGVWWRDFAFKPYSFKQSPDGSLTPFHYGLSDSSLTD